MAASSRRTQDGSSGPKAKAHITQWKHNRRFLETIQPSFPDWAVTVIFYAALHSIDALLETDGVEGIASHEARNRTLIRTNRYEQIWKHYQPLHDLSRTIRYLAVPNQWVTWGDINSNVIKRYLYPIEASIQKLMKRDLKLLEIQLNAGKSPREAEKSS